MEDAAEEGTGVFVVAGSDAALLLQARYPRSTVLRFLYISGSKAGGRLLVLPLALRRTAGSLRLAGRCWLCSSLTRPAFRPRRGNNRLMTAYHNRRTMQRIGDWIARARSSIGWVRRPKTLGGAARPSIALVHFADRLSAVVGETVSFRAWILNDSGETLTGVVLILRSFTNAQLQNLGYSTEPESNDLNLASLASGESAEFVFTYVVGDQDVTHGDEIVSAMQVKAVSTSGVLWDECDAIVRIGGSSDGNPYFRIPWETSHMSIAARNLVGE